MNSHHPDNSSDQENSSGDKNIFDYFPKEIINLIIANLDPEDFRLSRVNKRMYTLFHSEWYNKYWQSVTKQVWGECPSEPGKSWVRYYRFRDRKNHSDNHTHSQLLRMVRTGDQLGAMMLDLHAEDFGRELVRAHVKRLTLLLSRLYQILLREVFNDGDLTKQCSSYYFYQLHYAVFCFEPPFEVEKLLKRGHAVDCVGVRGHTPLHIAAGSGQVACVELLIKYDANVKSSSRQGDTPLSEALEKGHENCVNALVEAGANFNEIYLNETAFSHAFESVKGGQISAEFCRIIEDNYIDMSLSIHERIFLLSCQKGFTELVKAMIKKNINLEVSISANTDIIKKQCEAMQCKSQVLTLLGNNEKLYYQNMPGFTALDLAIVFDRVEVAKLITSRMDHAKLHELLTFPHLNLCATTMQLAEAINRAEMIDHLDGVFKRINNRLR